MGVTSSQNNVLYNKFENAVIEYYQFGSEEKRQMLSQILRNNDCCDIVAKSTDNSDLCSAFICCSYKNHSEILQAFLDCGININTKNKNGWTALMCASQYGHKEILQLLLNRGANIDLKNEDGQTALDYAKTDEIKEMIQNHINTSYILK